jgi:CRP-like cAMP-binding protein
MTLVKNSMVTRSRVAEGNRLLQKLSAADFDLLEPCLTRVDLKLRQDLEKPNKQVEHVYFPETGIASVVAVHPDDNRVEIGIIGCEGMTGIPILLGNGRSPHSTYMQVAGRGWRIETGALRKAIDSSPSLKALALKYVQAFMVQTSHTAIANARASLPERLARWLLMAHDRVPADHLALTHEFISLMMGVRRAGVTEALHELVRKDLITARRGEITVVDRDGIAKLAGHYYGTPESEYRRLLS